ncbi:MAG: GGDEF domain-containing protein [Peptococcaceae bacterium]|nr:GGDEF domain-containing protein [Peptococcaceae bacterium]
MRKLTLAPWKSVPPAVLFAGGKIAELDITWPDFSEPGYQDHLTGLPNRRAFDEALQQAVEQADLQGAAFGLIILDLDHFKQINDTHGHQAGDAILQFFATMMASATRDTDLAARYGGEEFVVLSPAYQEIFNIGERIRLAVSQAPFHLSPDIHVTATCSFGCAVYPQDAPDKDRLIKAADKALYTAKEAGRNQGRRAGGEGGENS